VNVGVSPNARRERPDARRAPRVARCALPVACCALLVLSLAAVGDEDDKAANPVGPPAQPTLNGEQQRAVGIVTAHPLAAKAPERMEALGVVLDPTALIADLGDVNAAGAAELSASAELARLHALYEGGGGASLRMLEAAQADQARALAQARAATARFALHWGPLSALPGSERQRLIEASASGRSLLLRADLTGRHTLGTLPSKAMLDVDGIQVPGRVMGTLRETTELQSVGVLIEVPSAPAGLGPGARVPVALLNAARAGLLLPREALLYGESGAYVYKQSAKKSDAENARYVPVKVQLLVPYGDGWLVEGVDDDDNIVVRGAGVLWSLQGVGAQQVEDDND
jgi:hypothetical protein